jgi:uncharacterized protein Veg
VKDRGWGVTLYGQEIYILAKDKKVGEKQAIRAEKGQSKEISKLGAVAHTYL